MTPAVKFSLLHIPFKRLVGGYAWSVTYLNVEVCRYSFSSVDNDLCSVVCIRL